MVEWASSWREVGSSRTSSVAGAEGHVMLGGRDVGGGARGLAEGRGGVAGGVGELVAAGEELELPEDCWGQEVTRLHRRSSLTCPEDWRMDTRASRQLLRSRQAQPGRRGRVALEQ